MHGECLGYERKAVGRAEGALREADLWMRGLKGWDGRVGWLACNVRYWMCLGKFTRQRYSLALMVRAGT